MKIIKNGNSIKRFKCDHCDCIFELTLVEYIDKKDIYYLGNNNISEFVFCPECGERVATKRLKYWDEVNQNYLENIFGPGCFETIINQIKKI